MNVGQVRSHELMRGIRPENCQDIAQTVARDSVESTRSWGGTEAGELLKYDLRKLGTAVEQEVARRGGPPIGPEQTAMAAGAILTAPLSGVIMYGLVEGLKGAPMSELASQVVDFVQNAPPEFSELSRSVQGQVQGQVPSQYVPVTMLLAGAELGNEQKRLDQPERLSSSGFLQLQLQQANGRLPDSTAQMAMAMQQEALDLAQMTRQQQAFEQASWKAQMAGQQAPAMPGWKAQRY